MISREHKVIFIHIPKCGGRTISEFFGKQHSHYTAGYYISQMPYCWKTYRKFAIVRNPYDRYVSIFHYLIQSGSHEGHQIKEYAVSDGFSKWLKTNIAYYSPRRKADFQNFRHEDNRMASNFWFNSQSSWLVDLDSQVLDYEAHIELSCGEIISIGRPTDLTVLKFESDFNYHGIDWRNIPRANQTTHRPWQEYYDKELLEIVNNFDPLVEDCERFNYDIHVA